MSGSISPWPVVKTGSSEHPIKTLQYLLRARGHSAVVDGVFGPQTEDAVKGFSNKPGGNGGRDRRASDLDRSRRAGQKRKPGRRG